MPGIDHIPGFFLYLCTRIRFESAYTRPLDRVPAGVKTPLIQSLLL